MDLEVLWYESLPYLYGIAGVIAIATRPGSMLLNLSGVLLIVAALTIVRLRLTHRRAQFAKAPTPSSLARDPFRDS